MNDAERKELELNAYGKRISFHTKHHWILTWLEERPGATLAGKVWAIINDAYRNDYEARGHAEMARYYDVLATFDYSDPAPQQAVLRDMGDALSNACEYFNRAGNAQAAEGARLMLGSVLFQQQKRADSAIDRQAQP